MNCREGRELKAGVESLATVEMEMIRLELHVCSLGKSVGTRSRTEGDKIQRHIGYRMDGPCHPCAYGEETKTVAVKSVEKTVHYSSTSLYYDLRYAVLTMESSERE